jgi:hypothetical protein
MKEPIKVILLAALVRGAIACIPGGDEAESGEDADDDAAQEALDRQVCQDAADEWFERECPVGFGPSMHLGDPFAFVPFEEVVVPICGDMGVFIDTAALAGMKRVGFDVTQNSVCTFGCFGGCGPGLSGCFGRGPAGGLCSSCARDIDEQTCHDSVLGCYGIDPDDVDAVADACGGGEQTTGG